MSEGGSLSYICVFHVHGGVQFIGVQTFNGFFAIVACELYYQMYRSGILEKIIDLLLAMSPDEEVMGLQVVVLQKDFLKSPYKETD